MKKVLLFIGLFLLYSLLTIAFFYITGMYIWTTLPTTLVLIRMILCPVVLEVLSLIIYFIFIKKKNQ